MTEQDVVANGVRIHVRDVAGGRPPLVFLPGLTVAGSIFAAVIDAGLRGRHRCTALDLRGRGRSEAPPAGYRMADHAADVLGVLDALAIERPVLVGHSFGGMLALYLAAEVPERFPRIVVLDAAASLADPATRVLIGPILARLEETKATWDDYLAAVKRLPYFQGWWDETAEAYFRDDLRVMPDGRLRAAADPGAIGAACEGLLAEDWPAIEARVRQPVLLLNATDPFGPPGAPPFLPEAGARATVERLRAGRYEAVPGNHLTMILGEFASRVARAIGAFSIEGDA